MLLQLCLLLACVAPDGDEDDDSYDGRHEDGGSADGGSDDGGHDPNTPIDEIDPNDLPQGDDPCRVPELVDVIDVHDGDTITVASSQGEEHVRFIGVDTPEIGYSGSEAECWGEEAAEFTRDLLLGEQIWLTFDADCIDPYDRTLAYLHTGLGEDDFVERLLLRTGQADTLTIAPNDTFEELFAKDQVEARSTGEGLWAACGGNP